MAYSGNAEIAIAIYAPSADFVLGGGGSTALDFRGATVTRTVTMNGTFNFHFDESLNGNATRGWVANGWDEISASVEAIVNKSLIPIALGS